MKQIRKLTLSIAVFLVMLLGFSPVMHAQETIRGQVVDANNGEALPGVNILVQGTNIGIATDADGEFELDVPSLDETLVVTYIGYQRQEVDLEGRTFINISLEQEGDSR